MKYALTSAAEQEVREIAAYYEQCRSGLGFAFLDALYAAFENAAEFPEAWPLLEKNKRRYHLSKFPYLFVYELAGEELRILGVVHMSRIPKQW